MIALIRNHASGALNPDDAHSTRKFIAFIGGAVEVQVFTEAKFDVDGIIDAVLVAVDEEAR